MSKPAVLAGCECAIWHARCMYSLPFVNETTSGNDLTHANARHARSRYECRVRLRVVNGLSQRNKRFES